MRLALCSLLLLAACTSHEVRCDAHLLPINVPAPVEVPGAGAPVARAPATGTPASAARAIPAPVSAPQPEAR
jgi:hypothetical protein